MPRNSTAQSRKGCTYNRHGLSFNPLYNRWRRMIQRCHGSKLTASKDYAGRGIVVCARWRKSFAAFMDDMGLPPTPQHSIERINNDGNYEPGNCRWATTAEQAMNRRNSILFTVDGVTRTLVDWMKLTTVTRECVEMRLKRGWPAKAALFLPAKVARPAGHVYGTKHFQVSGVDVAANADVKLLPMTPHGAAQTGTDGQVGPLICAVNDHAPVAQLDRATVFGTVGKTEGASG